MEALLSSTPVLAPPPPGGSFSDTSEISLPKDRLASLGKLQSIKISRPWSSGECTCVNQLSITVTKCLRQAADQEESLLVLIISEISVDGHLTPTAFGSVMKKHLMAGEYGKGSKTRK